MTSYRGEAAQNVLNALREINLAELPPDSEPGRTKLVLEIVTNQLTSFRNIIKSKVTESISPGCKFRNLAALAHAVVGPTMVKPTLQLYIRLAFIRWHVVNYPKIEEEFWPKVDETLQKWRTDFTTRTELDSAFNQLYNADKVEYGDPALSEFSVIEARNVPDWQVTLSTHAKRVIAPSKSRKRRRGNDKP
ncbi:hypothetical protein PLICRDRAFT_179322 [Plicaturopsis crispa FD-325 SS-3]|uniref:Uncharacterized protein n=1 Tax=Plicaturopsis crispa FD-325 SS-3 TaxID=944288 RepID=A0A0C9T557_PLICR|nr:hypothetical protein PLICRDRAFT_179322 [Plicaturopsis crispa FD-325 SS-3]